LQRELCVLQLFPWIGDKKGKGIDSGEMQMKEETGCSAGRDAGFILTCAHMKYLTAIYELSIQSPDVFSAEIAKKLGVTKPSVTAMLNSLISKDLVAKEKYGKVHLTGKGSQIAENYARKISFIKGQIPGMKLKLSEEDTEKAASALAEIIPDSLLNNGNPS